MLRTQLLGENITTTFLLCSYNRQEGLGGSRGAPDPAPRRGEIIDVLIIEREQRGWGGRRGAPGPAGRGEIIDVLTSHNRRGKVSNTCDDVIYELYERESIKYS